MTKSFEFKAPRVSPIKAIRGGAAHGLALAAQEVLGRSNQTVPIEEGTLMRSGKASVSTSGTRAAVSYDTPYAVRQHEDLTYRHDKGRTAKYLENALNESRGDILRLIAQGIRAKL